MFSIIDFSLVIKDGLSRAYTVYWKEVEEYKYIEIIFLLHKSLNNTLYRANKFYKKNS